MKKIVLVLLLAISFVGFSQEKKEMKKERLTNEQRAELESKKMKLELDLNDKQTAEVKRLLLEQQNKGDEVRKMMKAKKESGVKPTQEEIFKMKNDLLDRQIAFKGDMKKLLTKFHMMLKPGGKLIYINYSTNPSSKKDLPIGHSTMEDEHTWSSGLWLDDFFSPEMEQNPGYPKS